MNQIIQTIMACLLASTLCAQSNIGSSIGRSKSDQHVETIWLQHQVSDQFSLGVQYRNSGIKYRFVNAIAIENGNAQFFGATLGYRIYSREEFRLDFNLTASYRMISRNSTEGLPSNTGGLEFDPNIIFGLKVSEQVNFRSGALFRMTSQISPELISDEQFFSAILLNGLSYNLGRNSLAVRNSLGPMAGASGDTEKFFWQASLGFQHNFGGRGQSLSFFNF